MNIGTAERGLSAIVGAALVVTALSLRSRGGLALGVGGAALLARGATGRCPLYRTLGVATGQASLVPGRRVTFMRSITIGATREEIVAAVRSPQQWLPAELEATSLGPQQWRIVLHLPGKRVADTEVSATVEDDGSLGWRSGVGSFEHQGRIFFGDAPRDGGSEIRLVASLKPPGGRAGLLLASPLRAAAERALGAALGRLKQWVEVGEITQALPAEPSCPRRVPVRVQRTADPVNVQRTEEVA